MRTHVYQLSRIGLVWALVFLLAFAVSFFARIDDVYSRVWAATWFVSGLFTLFAGRLILASLVRYWTRMGRLVRRTVIVGGGPTGVEMAGAVAELALKALPGDFRHIDPRTAKVLLLEAGPRLLPSFPEPLGDYAKHALERLGVEVRLLAPVTGCDADGVLVKSERIPSATVVWAAGVAASPAAAWLGAEADRAGRVIVGANFEVPGHPNVFAIGDTALYRDAGGQPLPGVAPVAKQQGHWVGRLIASRVAGKAEPAPFRYRDAGQLATIGRRAAVVDFGRLRFKGWLAWWFWGIVHIYFLISTRSRMIVATEWLWSYLTYDRGARLITRDL